jgi:hypothetical protein
MMLSMHSGVRADPPGYPVIAACIGEGRGPSLSEVRRLIRRVRREAFPGKRIDAVLRRRISLAALAALGMTD